MPENLLILKPRGTVSKTGLFEGIFRKHLGPEYPAPRLVIWNPKVSAQISETRSNAPHRHNQICASIARLLARCGPSTVSRLIIPIVIRKPVNACSGGFLAHVFQEVLKRLAPPLAYLNASASIVVIIFNTWIGTSTVHLRPSNISSGAVVSPSMSVAFIRSVLPLKTAAGCTYSVTDVAQVKVSYRSAVTAAHHALVVAGSEWFSDYGKSCKLGSEWDISFCRHNVDLFNVVFSGGRPATTGAHCDSLRPRGEVKA